MASLAVWKAIATVQISTASVSLVASLAVAVSVGAGGGLTSNTGAYKRIIFNISIADIIQSISLIVGPFAPPAEVRQAAWSVGNKTTCTIDGFFFSFGGCLFIMTTAFLSFYFLRKIKSRSVAGADVVTVGLELKIYSFVVLTSLIFNLAGVYLKTINTSVNGLSCLNGSALPTWCRRFSQVECLEPLATHAAKLNGFYMGIISVSFAVVVLCMGLILWHVIVRDKIFRAMRSGMTHLNSVERQTSIDRNDDVHDVVDDERPQLRTRRSSIAIIEAANRADTLRALYLRETTVQAFLYTGSVFLCYGPYVVTNLLIIRGVNLSIHALEGLAFGIAAFYPLSGLSTILIYARPAVGHLRRNYPEFSWIKSFFMVIKAGGEVPILPAAPDSNAARINGTEPKPEISSLAFGCEGIRVKESLFSSKCAHGGSERSISLDDIRFKPEKEWFHLEGKESIEPLSDLPFARPLTHVDFPKQEIASTQSESWSRMLVSGLSNDASVPPCEILYIPDEETTATILSHRQMDDHEA
jgi:hypothetical protein